MGSRGGAAVARGEAVVGLEGQGQDEHGYEGVRVGTGGGPAYATWFFALHIYHQAFEFYRLGYGSALAWLFAVVLIIFTVIQLRLSGRWVYYEGGDS